jgi:hypothetical protein
MIERWVLDDRVLEDAFLAGGATTPALSQTRATAS